MISVDKDQQSDREQEGPMEAISDGRVSTEEQVKEGVSLAAQEARLWAYCAVVGLSLIKSLRDEGVSAARPLATRPGGAALLRALARHQAQHVVVVTLDRRAPQRLMVCRRCRRGIEPGSVCMWSITVGNPLHSIAVGRIFLTMSGIRGNGKAPDRRAHRGCHATHNSAPSGVCPDALRL
jgi:Resolvase, N terminal domain